MAISLYIKKSSTEASKLVEITDYSYTLASGTGWYRIASTSVNGASCEIEVAASSQEVHFYASTTNAVKVFSSTNSPITEIRSVSSGTTGYIDIYVETSTELTVAVRAKNNGGFTFSSTATANATIPDGYISSIFTTAEGEVNFAAIANQVLVDGNACTITAMTESEIDSCLA